jgi:type I restriction enzyme S subunit
LDELPALIQQYRAAVLEAACTGHLVTIESELARKEHRDFEPATVLLDRILAERRAKWEADQLAKMRAANKESKDDRWKAHYNEPNTPIVDDSKLLPKGWVTASLGQVCFIDSGEAFKKSSYSQSGIRLLQIANVAFGHTDWQQKNFLPEHFDKTHPGLMLNPGDLVMALNRPILGNQLKVAHIITSDLPAILYQRVGRLRPVAANLSKYLFCFLRTDFFRNQVASRLKGSDQPFINTSQVPDIPIALPPDDEQKRIVAEVEHRLSALSLIENQVTLALEEVARFQGLLLKTALSGKLAHQNRSDEPASRLLLRIRKLKEQLAMQPKIRAFTPSRLKPEKLPMLTLEDIKSTHLADILHKHRGPLDSKTLWKESRLTIDDFYAQLKKELGKTLKETGKARLLEVKS